jgi:hypothetical protein
MMPVNKDSNRVRVQGRMTVWDNLLSSGYIGRVNGRRRWHAAAESFDFRLPTGPAASVVVSRLDRRHSANIIQIDQSEALMDEPTDKVDASGKPALRIAGLCICVLAASLGVISLGAGLHRVSLTQTWAPAAGACLIANSLWPYRLWQVGAVVLSVAAVGAFLLGIR